MTHREAIKQWLSEIELKDVLVFDWGSGSKPAMRYINHDGCTFVTIDKNPQIAADRRAPKHHVINIEEPVNLGQSDVAFCMEVLEHCIRPDKVLDNIYKNLQPNGRLYLSMPYDFPIHSQDDYFRLTPFGLELMLTQAGFREIDISGTVDNQGHLATAVK